MSKIGSRGTVTVAGVLLHVLPAVLFFALFAAVGIVHVSSRVLVVDAGYRLSRAEAEGRALARENDRLKVELAMLKAPARLERMARDQLGMAMPGPAAVISVAPRPVRPRPAEARPAVQLADRSAAR